MTTHPEPVGAGPIEPTPSRSRTGVVGPFRAKHILTVLIVAAGVAGAILLSTAPVARLGAIAPANPDPSSYLVGPPVEGLRVGDLAPELAVARADGSTFQLTDLDGRPVRLDALRGRAVWINFWASWCPPCQAETPVLRALAAEYKPRGLTLIGISVQETSAEDVAAYAERYSLGYTIAPDLDAHIFRRYRVYGIPTQFFIRPDGRISAVIAAPLDEVVARAHIESILPPP